MNTFVADAVEQCCEYLNNTLGTFAEFLADTIKIERMVDALGFETWKISAWKDEKPFMYAWYVDGNYIVCDGF